MCHYFQIKEFQLDCKEYLVLKHFKLYANLICRYGSLNLLFLKVRGAHYFVKALFIGNLGQTVTNNF